jgi:hypothetical protein
MGKNMSTWYFCKPCIVLERFKKCWNPLIIEHDVLTINSLIILLISYDKVSLHPVVERSCTYYRRKLVTYRQINYKLLLIMQKYYTWWKNQVVYFSKGLT